MAVQFCPHCEVPLTKDEERRRRCPACKKSLRVPPAAPEPPEPPKPTEAGPRELEEGAREPDEPEEWAAPADDAERWHALPSRAAPRTTAVSVAAVLVTVLGVAHIGFGTVLTFQLEQARQKALEPTKVQQADGTVREYPQHGCVVAMANFCLPVFMAVTVTIALVGVGLVLTGRGLWKRRRWARVVTFVWMCFVAQVGIPTVVSTDSPYTIALGVLEIVFAVGSCVVLYRNGAEFRRPPVDDEY